MRTLSINHLCFVRALLLLTFCLAGNVFPAGAATSAEVQAQADKVIAQVLEPWKGDLDGMVKRRYVRMLVVFSRTNYFTDKGEERGLTCEGGRLFEKFLNERLKTGPVKLHIMFIPVRRDQLFQALEEGRGDIAAANLTITPERQERADFSVPFLRDVREVVVTGPEAKGLTSPEDLAGKEVYVRRSSSYYGSLTRLNASLAQAGKPPAQIVEANEQLEDEDLLEMVNAGIIPATVVDNHLAEFWVQIFDGIKVHGFAAVNTGGEIGWAIRKGCPKLKAMVDEFAAEYGKGTLLFNVLFKRYLRDTKYVNNATSEEEQRKFRAVVEFFRKYGEEQNLPWLLLAAQGYQESQLDQSRRNPSGAVGIMQIKPSTAAGAPILVKGVDKSAERNIEAGAKYLRFIMDEFYKDEPMSRLNKGLFAVASYNAGPARINRLRSKAAQMGFDPNKWFQNVEVVAAREIGRETVQYVSNIYKYYVAYKLVLAQREAKKKLLESEGVQGAPKQ